MLCVYTASSSSKSQRRITSLSSSQRGKRLIQGCNHPSLKKAFLSVFKRVQRRCDSLYNRGTEKVGKCHSCGLIKDLNEDLTDAVRVVSSGSRMCVRREGRRGDTGEGGKGVGCEGRCVAAVHSKYYSSSWLCVPALLENYI